MLFRLIRKHKLPSQFPLITLTLQLLDPGEVDIEETKAIPAQGTPISGYNPTQQTGEEVKKILR